MEGVERHIIALCFGVGTVACKGVVSAVKDCAVKLAFPGATPAELSVMMAKESGLIVPLFLHSYRFAVHRYMRTP